MLLMRPRRFVAVIAVALAVSLPLLDARGATAVTFHVHADVAVRLQVALSPSGAKPCDSSDNGILYDGMIDPGEDVTLSVGPGPICVRHTYDDFPGSNWGPSVLWFRRPTMVRLDAHVPPG
jgi:hypothetical protein